MREFFGDDIEFGAPVDEITFARRIRDLPVVSADVYLNELLIKYCEEALSHVPGRRGSFRASVENAIAPLLPHGRVTVAGNRTPVRREPTHVCTAPVA